MSWKTVKIEEIASVKGGKRLPVGHDFLNEQTPHLYIRARDIGGNKISIINPVYISDSTFNKIKNYTVIANDLVITIVGANIGDVGFITQSYDGANLTENAARIRVDKRICEPRFLSFQMSNQHVKEKFRLLASGAAQGKLGLYKINMVDVALPPMAVQQKIASILSAYDDLIENNRRRIQLLEESARQLYKEWFVRLRFPGHEHVKVVDGVPEGWERKALGEVVETNIASYSNKSLPARINYVDISSVSTGRICEKKGFSNTEAPGRARRKASTGDVIWSNVRPNLKAYALVLSPEKNDVFSTGFTIITAKEVPYTFLYVSVTTDAFVSYLSNQTTGSSYPAVRPTDFERAKILIPSRKLLQSYHEAVEALFLQIHIFEKQNRKLAQARDLLLPKLMSGEVAV